MIGAFLGMGACDGTAQTDRLSDYIEEVEEDNEDLENQIKEMEASLEQAQAKLSLQQAQAKSVHRQTAVVDSMIDQVKGLQWELCSHQSTLSSGGEIGAVLKGVSGNREPCGIGSQAVSGDGRGATARQVLCRSAGQG